jgi:DNA-binding GntR family transcriptional regulator
MVNPAPYPVTEAEHVFERLAPRTLRTRIAQHIREAILTNKLKEGERLVERKLASGLGASLTAVREALIELESEGFIVKKANLGTYVNKMGMEDIEKIFELRSVLESFAVGEAARHATGEQIAKLEKTYLEMVDGAQAKDARTFNQRDREWHSQVWQMSGNEYVEAALRRAVLPYFAFIAIRAAALDPLSLVRDAVAHLPLLEVIQSGDPDKAQQVFASTLESWLAITRAEFARF